MYLTRFRKKAPGPGKWQPDHPGSKQDLPDLDSALTRADAVLNSEETAHKVFSKFQGDNEKVHYDCFCRFVRLVKKAVTDFDEDGLGKYALEAVTYALLLQWIEVRQAQLKIDREKPT